jgi:hypothetical protein
MFNRTLYSQTLGAPAAASVLREPVQVAVHLLAHDFTTAIAA